jgi:hypothetical protein
MDAIQHYFEEECFYYSTMHDFKCLVEDYGDRVFDELEHYAPELYEAWSAHKANKEIAEFLSKKSKDGCDDYFND